MTRPTPTTTHRAVALFGAAGVALLLTACGANTENQPSNGAKGVSATTFAADAFKHAECMRKHGVPGFPNPQVINTPTEHQIRQELPQGVAEAPDFKVAEAACKGLIPAPQNGGPGNAREQRNHVQVLLAFARCLRSHGVQDFPDPNAQGQLTLTMVHAAGVDLQAPSVLTAAKACVGTTHGAITLAQVEEAIHHHGGEGPGSGSEASSASPGPNSSSSGPSPNGSSAGPDSNGQ